MGTNDLITYDRLNQTDKELIEKCQIVLNHSRWHDFYKYEYDLNHSNQKTQNTGRFNYRDISDERKIKS